MTMTSEPPGDAMCASTHPAPYGWYAAQAAQPFAFDAQIGCWVAARAVDIAAVLACPVLGVRPPEVPVPPALAGGPLGTLFPRLVRMSDGPQQRAAKASLIAALADVSDDALRGLALEMAARLPLERVQFDLPVLVLARLLGMADADLPPVPAAVRAVVAALAPGATEQTVVTGQLAAAALLTLLAPCAHQAGALTHALAQGLRAAGYDDPLLVLANALGCMQQASDATAGLIGLTVARCRTAGAAGRAASNATTLDATLEEVLRRDPPIQHTRRWAQRDVDLLGQQLRRSDAVLVLLAAGSHDPACAGSASDAPLTFGRGVHACPGQRLARQIAAAGVARLLEHAEEVRIDGFLPLPNARVPLLRFTAPSRRGRVSPVACRQDGAGTETGAQG